MNQKLSAGNVNFLVMSPGFMTFSHKSRYASHNRTVEEVEEYRDRERHIINMNMEIQSWTRMKMKPWSQGNAVDELSWERFCDDE